MQIGRRSMFGILVIVGVVIVFTIIYQNFFAPPETPSDNNLTATVSKSASELKPTSQPESLPAEEQASEPQSLFPLSFEGLSEELESLDALDTSLESSESQGSNPIN